MPHVSAPLLDLVDPAPYQGNTALSRASSASGAVFSLEGRRAKTKRYLELLAFMGPTSDHGIAHVTGWPLASVNSIRCTVLKQAWKAEQPPPIVPGGVETVVRAGGRQTTRTKWRLA